MKDLSLHILDIAQNSIKAGADLIEITLDEVADKLTVTIRDNGCGMSPALLNRVLDPFTTTRTTRKVGLGLPLYKQAAEQTGGSLRIESAEGAGTTVTAIFHQDHIDALPLGDLPATLQTLVQGAAFIDFVYLHTRRGRRSELDTRVLRRQLGEVSLTEPEVLRWIADAMKESEEML